MPADEDRAINIEASSDGGIAIRRGEMLIAVVEMIFEIFYITRVGSKVIRCDQVVCLTAPEPRVKTEDAVRIPPTVVSAAGEKPPSEVAEKCLSPVCRIGHVEKATRITIDWRSLVRRMCDCG